MKILVSIFSIILSTALLVAQSPKERSPVTITPENYGKPYTNVSPTQNQQNAPIQQVLKQPQGAVYNSKNENASNSEGLVLPESSGVELAPDTEGTRVQIAVLLDTSNSMDGLIDQAKSQLWKMVSELALAKDANGEVPQLELALYEYGNQRIDARTGYIRQVAGLTTDLDKISEELFALTTSGGNEFCGQVIHASTLGLNWSESNDDLKIIFIAGNEAFTQGPFNYQDACKAAISKGIVVNTIFCGDAQEGIDTKWKDGADLADGKYINIDQAAAVVHIDAPQDERLEELNNELNKTYLGYGAMGDSKKSNQMTQDVNAMSYGKSNAAVRAVSKASSNYKNSSWDLVDAVEEEAISLEKMEADDLPEEMKDLEVEEREGFVKELAENRSKIQEEIKALDKERRTFIANERKKQSDGEGNTLDGAINQIIREQALLKNFCFDESK